ncbi:hypothetical protein ACOMHN_010289 [Nucella lapillus]
MHTRPYVRDAPDLTTSPPSPSSSSGDAASATVNVDQPTSPAPVSPDVTCHHSPDLRRSGRPRKPPDHLWDYICDDQKIYASA